MSVSPTSPETASTTDVAELRALVSKALKLPALTDDDNFLDLGVGSLELVRLANALRARHLDISVAELYEHSTFAGIQRLVATASVKRPRTPEAKTDRRASAASEEYDPGASEDRVAHAVGSPSAHPARQPLSTAVAFILLKAILGSKTTYWSTSTEFAKTIDVERLLAAWISVVHDAPILRTRIDLTDKPCAVIEDAVHASFTSWDASELSLEGFRAKCRSIASMRCDATFDATKVPYWHVDVVLGPEGRSTFVFSYAVIVIDLSSLDAILGELWRRYEGEERRPLRVTSLFGDTEREHVAPTDASLAFARTMFAGVTKPTRIPHDATSFTFGGIANGLVRASLHWGTIRAFAGTPAAPRLLELAGAGGPKRRPTLAAARGLLGVLSATVPRSGSVFASTWLREQVRRRVRDLRVTEQSCFMTALGIVLARWSGATYAILRVIAHPTSEGGGRATRDFPVCVRADPDLSIGATLKKTHASIAHMLDTPNAREAALAALPFGEPITDAIYIAGELPGFGVPVALEPVAWDGLERNDVLCAMSVGWERSEFGLFWDETRIRSTTARARLDAFLATLEAIVTLDPETPVRRLPA